MAVKKNHLLNIITFAVLPLILLLFAFLIEGSSDAQKMDSEPEVSESFFSTTKEAISELVAPLSPNQIPVEYSDQTIASSDILNDKLNRVSDDFKLSESLKKRVGFWLDIYTKFSSRFVLIHDQDRPWIVYKIIDVRDIYDRPASDVTKEINDHRFVKKQMLLVRRALLNLSKMKRYNHLSPEEEKYYALLSETKGKKRSIFKQAAHNIRQQRGQKDFFRQGLIESSKYFTEMESIFARHEIPAEIVRLPLVESSFNEQAQSKVGASGVWQFMPAIGRKFLHISDHTDERNSPIKATEAAAKLLRSNYRILKSWPLAIAAYNHGASGIIRATKELKTKNIEIILEKFKTKRFSFASQNFYTEFLAALYAEKYQTEVFGALSKPAALYADTFKLKRRMRLKEIAKVAGVTLEEIKLHNPDLKKKVLNKNLFLPTGYKIRLPVGSLSGRNFSKLEKLPSRTQSGIQNI